MGRLQTSGQISVQDLRNLDPTNVPASNINITGVESTWMNKGVPPAAANQANSNAPGLCMPNQAQRVSGSNWTYAPPGGFSPADAWKSTAMSEFYTSYNDRPSVTLAVAGTGTANQAVLTCTGSNPGTSNAPYSFYPFAAGSGSVTESGGLNGWFVATALNGTVRTISINSAGATWTVAVRDVNNCGQAKEFTSNSVVYPQP